MFRWQIADESFGTIQVFVDPSWAYNEFVREAMEA